MPIKQGQKKAGIIVFPGTNCDKDTKMASDEFGFFTEYIWHDDCDLSGYDVIFLPGGFSYGDYINAGRLAKFSKVILALKEYIAHKKGAVVGICNGFQILCEAGFLPGALTTNVGNKFVCKKQKLILKSGRNEYENNIELFIAHKEGRYYVDDETLKQVKDNDMIFLKYDTANDINPNGSVFDIAGIIDRENKILGMMPHPERSFFPETACSTQTFGKNIFKFIYDELL